MATKDPHWYDANKGRAKRDFDAAASRESRDKSDGGDESRDEGRAEAARKPRPQPVLEMKGPIGDAARAQARQDAARARAEAHERQQGAERDQKRQERDEDRERPDELRDEFNRVR